MFHHVIVPFDGTLEARAALAPAADLAWRCGAKMVIVTTLAIDDEAAQYVLKSQAIAKSGADVSFWVDAHAELGDAVLEATRFRSDPIVCMASRYRNTGLVRRKQTPSALPEAVLRHASVPVLIVGPEADLSTRPAAGRADHADRRLGRVGAGRALRRRRGGIDAAGGPVPGHGPARR